MRKKITIDHTPSFTHNNSLNSEVIVDSGYDFSEDMIDEHVGASPVPKMVSPRENSQHESLCRVLKSIENIENTNMYNHQSDKHAANGGYDTKSSKILKKNSEWASYNKSTLNY